MAATNALLVAATDLAAASALLYTSPANGAGTLIDKATAVNHSGATRQVTINHVPSAGAAASFNLLVNAKPIADKTTYLLPELVGKFIPAGASLYGFADAAAGVSIEISGRELT
jgi:hypothetical protein